ncbi:hypothetical protein [Sinobaca sp. H24]|uniref:hypothetical protein n=1 Tax=Sinobaca sp. H24 TaxID=2923376 RepID=UPI00207B0397|nr:hypothetical protein [Sinobaca sp. H24]
MELIEVTQHFPEERLEDIEAAVTEEVTLICASRIFRKEAGLRLRPAAGAFTGLTN